MMIMSGDEKTAFKAKVNADRARVEAEDRVKYLGAIRSKGDRVSQTRAQQNWATLKWIYLNGPHPQHRALSAYEDKGFALGITVLFLVPVFSLVIGLLLSN